MASKYRIASASVGSGGSFSNLPFLSFPLVFAFLSTNRTTWLKLKRISAEPLSSFVKASYNSWHGSLNPFALANLNNRLNDDLSIS